MSDALETLAGGPSAALPLPVAPTAPSGHPLADAAAELYDAWRKHIERGFENNNRMFDRTLNAFMYPYWVTVGMYIVLFVVGISAFVVAARLSFESGKEMYTLLFGGIGAVAFLTRRPQRQATRITLRGDARRLIRWRSSLRPRPDDAGVGQLLQRRVMAQ